MRRKIVKNCSNRVIQNAAFKWGTPNAHNTPLYYHDRLAAYLIQNNPKSYTLKIVRGEDFTFMANTKAKAKAKALSLVRKEIGSIRSEKEYQDSQPTVAGINKMLSTAVKDKYGKAVRVEPVAFSTDKYRITFESGHTQETKIPKRHNPRPKKSKGHLLFSGDFEYFVKDGDIWKANLTSVIEHTGTNKGYRASRFWATDTPFHRSYAKNRERAMREDHITKSNPHGFCIVDQHLNKIATGKDYDKLQDRVDKHNEGHDEKWFVIDESDYMELNKKGRRNPKASKYYYEDAPSGMTEHAIRAYNAVAKGMTSDEFYYGKNRHLVGDYDQYKETVKKHPFRLFRKASKRNPRKHVIYVVKWKNGEQHFTDKKDAELYKRLLEGKGRTVTLTEKPRTAKNVSMGYFDASGFHPIRASHDYDEDLVDEHYRKRPVRKYARKEKAFKGKRHNSTLPQSTINHVRRSLAKQGYPANFINAAIRYFKDQPISFRSAFITLDGIVEFLKDNEYLIRSNYMQRRNTSNPENSELFNIDKLDKLSGIFQGHINGKQVKTVGSDWTPPLTARLGKLAYMKLKNGKETYEINFDANGDAWLSADARKNIYLEGKDARIANAALPKRGNLTWLGEVQQVNYRTNKSHIENGQLVEYYHELGEVDGVKPNAFLDHDGFILLNGGNYDIDVHGIEN